MDKTYIKNKEDNYERICRIYGKCGNDPKIMDSSKITLYGLYCLNKNEKAKAPV